MSQNKNNGRGRRTGPAQGDREYTPLARSLEGIEGTYMGRGSNGRVAQKKNKCRRSKLKKRKCKTPEDLGLGKRADERCSVKRRGRLWALSKTGGVYGGRNVVTTEEVTERRRFA